jgi:hypothetical protein
MLWCGTDEVFFLISAWNLLPQGVEPRRPEECYRSQLTNSARGPFTHYDTWVFTCFPLHFPQDIQIAALMENRFQYSTILSAHGLSWQWCGAADKRCCSWIASSMHGSPVAASVSSLYMTAPLVDLLSLFPSTAVPFPCLMYWLYLSSCQFWHTLIFNSIPLALNALSLAHTAAQSIVEWPQKGANAHSVFAALHVAMCLHLHMSSSMKLGGNEMWLWLCWQ